MHHVASRSIAAERIYKDGGDYATWIGILARLVDEGLMRCHAFCVMPTHWHLFGTFENVSTAIHRLNRRYAVAYNRRYRRRGHVFDSPFSRRPIEGEAQARSVLRYIALNPTEPDVWAYSSYPGTVGLREPFSFVDLEPVRSAFGSVETFREFTELGRQARDMELGSSNRALQDDEPSSLTMITPPSCSPTRSKPFRS